MPNFRYIIRLTTAFINRFKSVLLASAFLGFVLFLALRLLMPVFLGRDIERIAISGRYYTSDLPSSILNLIGEGLTSVDEAGIPQPALAENWESLDSGKTWKFTLKDNLFWQDGTPVTAQSVKYSFEDVEISTPDNKTIIYKLKDPFAPFPTVVSRPTFKKGLLGTGTWEVEKLTLSGNVIEELILNDSKKNKKIFRFYPTDERAKLAFKLGEVDIVENITDPKPLDAWSTVEMTEIVNERHIVAVFFNNNSEMVADKRVRQALSYAIDKDALGGVRAISNIWPNSWAYNPQTKPYEYDEKHAKDLLSQSELSPEQKENLKMKLATTPLLLSVAEKIAKDWEKIGVKTTVQVASTLPDDYQAYLAMYDIPTDPDQYSTWHSTQIKTNITNYKNTRVDTLLEQGRQELDLETRKKVYLDFQRFLMEDSPIIVLYHPSVYTITRL